MTPRIVNNQESLAAFSMQLKAAGLPHDDLTQDDHILISYHEEDTIIGTGGVEIYGDYGLIRSVSIAEGNRGKKLGSKIVYHLIDKAKESDLKGLYLLTETAKDFFIKIGFEVVDRKQATEEIKACSEFSHVCPESATCMYLNLQSSC